MELGLGPGLWVWSGFAAATPSVYMGLKVVGEHRFTRSPVRSELQSQQRTQVAPANMI
jgi:hypothetical protein